MASTYSSATFQIHTSCKAHSSKPASLPTKPSPVVVLDDFRSSSSSHIIRSRTADSEGRRHWAFGIRKRIKEVEKEAEEIVEAAEKEVEAAEEEIIENAVGFGGFAQAGVVAGAEVLGVFVASSVVNGILGPEGQKS